ncbi:hypothetical protein NCCP1664_23810 [Zafaria cholistanensis]|uniref:Uncharacterized protein n=1 Tax=Zafaria cholistanensis TaxID=1682741 RepID=A0A5A7NTH5_9MICC|nr:hypothetical protein NCCP1664_23810 [Zafaria cholistanensis]
MSAWHTPLAATEMRTHPGSGAAAGTVSSASPVPAALTLMTAALVVTFPRSRSPGKVAGP